MVQMQRRRRASREKMKERKFFLFISPWIIGFGLFSLVPMVLSLVLSFTWGTRITTWTSEPLEISLRN